MLSIIEGQGTALERFLRAQLDARHRRSGDVAQRVQDIIARIENGGAPALLALCRELDRQDAACVSELKVSPAELATARQNVPQKIRDALQLAAQRIRAHHQTQSVRPSRRIDAQGVELATKITPLASVGVYVPGGLASYPSSVLMNVIPARIAGVQRIVMTVPAPDGQLAPQVLYAAELAGVDEIYRIGGAQAVAALALGNAGIAPVDKIVGPGNAFVAEAKRQLYGRVGIDMIAGPSEVLIIADGSADPDWIAADLLAQAEHDTSARALLLTNEIKLAHRVCVAIETRLERLQRRRIAQASLEANGAIVVTVNLDAAARISNILAPEHLELVVEDPDMLLDHINHAGTVFLGAHTPEAIGDYIAGSNHVLPTGGAARYASGLSVFDFVKRINLVRCSQSALNAIGPAAVTLAHAEQLGGHADSVSCRLRLSGP